MIRHARPCAGHPRLKSEQAKTWMAGRKGVYARLRRAMPGHDGNGFGRMHDIRFIRDHPDAFKRGLARRGLNGDEILQEIEQLDGERRANIALVQKWQEDRNRKSKEIGLAKAAGDTVRVTQLMQEVSRLKSDIANAAAQVSDEATGKLRDKLAEIPNLPADDVPDGKDATDNVERHRFGAKLDYSFTPKQHFDLGEALGQMDFETAAKLSGARFVVLKKGLRGSNARLGNFSSMCIQASRITTPKSLRRCLCATK